MKKVISLATALIMVLTCIFVFASCSDKTNENGTTVNADTTAADSSTTGETNASEGSDLEYVKSKGSLIVGITDFEPMDYKNADGEWIGFDADLATKFAESLGVKVEFVEIEWENKVLELNGKHIDCVWNGMTLTEDVLTAMECSDAYCNNAQVIVVPADAADKYQTAESCKELDFAVENGSAGEDMAKENEFNYTPVDKQSTAVSEVASGTSEAAIIDSLMAGAMVGEGTGYPQLTVTAKLNSEEYGVGFRKGSDLAAALNDFFAAAKADGSMQKLAETYGVQEALIK